MITIQNLDNKQSNQLNEELSDQELSNVVGGYYGYVYNPYQQLNSYYWPSTQAILQQTQNFQIMSDIQNANWLANF